MGIHEMEFQWRLNWWYRPTQLDGFETSVADYYDCFCDWKANMELNSCPAVEADYTAAFIQNLRCDIRSRLPKYIFCGSLICVFLAAKLEESMLRIDKALKKNGGHKPFDEIPSQVPGVCQEHSSDESNEVVIADDESSGLKDADSLISDGGASIIDVLSTQNDYEKETHKVFDELTEPKLAESSSIDQVSENDDYSPAIENEALLEGNAESLELKEVLESAVLSCSDAIVPRDDDVVVQIETDPEKILAPNADHKVFDESSQPNFTAPGWKLFPKEFNSISTSERVGFSSFKADIQHMHQAEELIQAESVLGKAAYQVFDETPELISMEHFEEHNSTPLIVSVPQVFDPGRVTTENIFPNGSSIVEIDGTFSPPFVPSLISPKNIEDSGLKDNASKAVLGIISTKMMFGGMVVFMFDPGVSSWNLKGCACIHLGEMLSNLVIFICIGKVLMVVFDPGGSWYRMRYLHFQLNGELSFLAKRLNSQAAQQLLERMLSTVLLIVCWLGLVEYAVNTKGASDLKIFGSVKCPQSFSIRKNVCTPIVFLAGGMTKNGPIPSDKMFDIVNIRRSRSSFTDGQWNIILLGKAPKLMGFILGSGTGQDIHGYMAAWIHKLQFSFGNRAHFWFF